ncbi:MAG: squalene/phytoene synthase family protein [Hyphomicrobiaceae bacterium]|nr:squalene/phytoene synthase family protein [Hyphomicrobiaceae bacterium]
MTDPLDIDTFAAQLRVYDPDRFLTARFAPKASRSALTILYAFNAELARVCDTVSEPALGEIRLQWWRDALEGTEGTAVTGAPLGDALARMVATLGLPIHLLLGMVDARSADLDDGGFADLQALKAYLYKTDGALFALSAHILGTASGQLAKTANTAGVAYGVARLLRFLPRDAAAGRIMLPLTMLQSHNVLPERILAGTECEGLRDLIVELSKEAEASLKEARGFLVGERKEVRGIFAPLALVGAYRRAVARPDRRPLHEVADINPLMRFLLLWRAARTGRL